MDLDPQIVTEFMKECIFSGMQCAKSGLGNDRDIFKALLLRRRIYNKVECFLCRGKATDKTPCVVFRKRIMFMPGHEKGMIKCHDKPLIGKGIHPHCARNTSCSSVAEFSKSKQIAIRVARASIPSLWKWRFGLTNHIPRFVSVHNHPCFICNSKISIVREDAQRQLVVFEYCFKDDPPPPPSEIGILSLSRGVVAHFYCLQLPFFHAKSAFTQ